MVHLLNIAERVIINIRFYWSFAASPCALNEITKHFNNSYSDDSCVHQNDLTIYLVVCEVSKCWHMCICNKYVTVLQIYNDYYDVGYALFEKNEKKYSREYNTGCAPI